MKVWILYENNRPYAGYVRAVFTTNDDIAPSQETREQLAALDFDIVEWVPVAGMLTNEALNNLILQEVRKSTLSSSPAEYLFGSVQSCVEAGDHLKQCDNDGYCKMCGSCEGEEWMKGV